MQILGSGSGSLLSLASFGLLLLAGLPTRSSHDGGSTATRTRRSTQLIHESSPDQQLLAWDFSAASLNHTGNITHPKKRGREREREKDKNR